MDLKQLKRAQIKTKISLKVLDACSEWGKINKPTTSILESIINRTAEDILQIIENED